MGQRCPARRLDFARGGIATECDQAGTSQPRPTRIDSVNVLWCGGTNAIPRREKQWAYSPLTGPAQGPSRTCAAPSRHRACPSASNQPQACCWRQYISDGLTPQSGSTSTHAAMSFNLSACLHALPNLPKLSGTSTPTAIMRAWRASSSSHGTFAKALRPAWPASWIK